jgi:hypothetical protein
VSCAKTGLFFEFALCRAERVFAFPAAAFGYLPRIPFERVTILPHQIDEIIFDREHTDGDVPEMNDTINPSLAVRLDDSVFPNTDPVVLVNFLRRNNCPGVLRLVRHESSLRVKRG